jgi:hypothetical protein
MGDDQCSDGTLQVLINLAKRFKLPVRVFQMPSCKAGTQLPIIVMYICIFCFFIYFFFNLIFIVVLGVH